MTQKYYTVYQLVQRLDSIPSVSIHTFEEVFEQDGAFIGTIKFEFEKPLDEIAVEHIQSVIKNASHWDCTIADNASEEISTATFYISTTAPTVLLEKFELT